MNFCIYLVISKFSISLRLCNFVEVLLFSYLVYGDTVLFPGKVTLLWRAQNKL